MLGTRHVGDVLNSGGWDGDVVVGVRWKGEGCDVSTYANS